MQAKVKDRVAVIAGAADEIGEEISTRLAGAGAKVVLCGGNVAALESIANKINAAGGTAAAMAVNLQDSAAIADWLGEIAASHGPIDILVTNAPEPERKGLGELTTKDFELTTLRTLTERMNLLKAVVPQMQKHGRGRVINLGSLYYLGLAKHAAGATEQSALFGLTRSAALEAARDNVTVNCVVKGDIARRDTAEEEREKLGAGIPVKRIGTPADVAYAVGFFASDTSDYITGQTFFVCGGKSNYFSMSV